MKFDTSSTFIFHIKRCDSTYQNVRYKMPMYLDEHLMPIPILLYQHDPYLIQTIESIIKRTGLFSVNMNSPTYFDCKCSSWLWILYRSPIVVVYCASNEWVTKLGVVSVNRKKYKTGWSKMIFHWSIVWTNRKIRSFLICLLL